MEKGNLKEAILEYGQYRDVWYMKDGKDELRRCLVVPAKIIEPLVKKLVSP